MAENLTAHDIKTLGATDLAMKARRAYQAIADEWNVAVLVYLVTDGKGGEQVQARDQPIDNLRAVATVYPSWMFASDEEQNETYDEIAAQSQPALKEI